ncbi:MAG: hypothetical protein AB8F65_14255 [Woeseiaceae bacterium]
MIRSIGILLLILGVESALAGQAVTPINGAPRPMMSFSESAEYSAVYKAGQRGDSRDPDLNRINLFRASEESPQRRGIADLVFAHAKSALEVNGLVDLNRLSLIEFVLVEKIDYSSGMRTSSFKMPTDTEGRSRFQVLSDFLLDNRERRAASGNPENPPATTAASQISDSSVEHQTGIYVVRVAGSNENIAQLVRAIPCNPYLVSEDRLHPYQLERIDQIIASDAALLSSDAND